MGEWEKRRRIKRRKKRRERPSSLLGGRRRGSVLVEELLRVELPQKGGLVLANGSLVAGDTAITADPEFLGDLRDETSVVTHQDHSSVKGVDGISESIDRFHVQVVRRLIENEDVGVLLGHEAEDDTGLLSIREELHTLGLGVSGDTKLSEPRTHFLFRGLGVQASHVTKRGEGEVELVDGVLVVPSETELVVELDGSVGGRELAHEEFEEGGLADSVGSDEGDT
mmetsp:Transcript_28114/g.47168  ORF Transcript_28114/g.47168 Transcript_28114/m.47168 type:complete len:225 (+) Transcript_28114:100-774(+)